MNLSSNKLSVAESNHQPPLLNTPPSPISAYHSCSHTRTSSVANSSARGSLRSNKYGSMKSSSSSSSVGKRASVLTEHNVNIANHDDVVGPNAANGDILALIGGTGPQQQPKAPLSLQADEYAQPRMTRKVCDHVQFLITEKTRKDNGDGTPEGEHDAMTEKRNEATGDEADDLATSKNYDDDSNLWRNICKY